MACPHTRYRTTPGRHRLVLDLLYDLQYDLLYDLQYDLLYDQLCAVHGWTVLPTCPGVFVYSVHGGANTHTTHLSMQTHGSEGGKQYTYGVQTTGHHEQRGNRVPTQQTTRTKNTRRYVCELLPYTTPKNKNNAKCSVSAYSRRHNTPSLRTDTTLQDAKKSNTGQEVRTVLCATLTL